MKKQSRTVIHRGPSDSQPQRHLALVDILVNTQTELQALVVASGLKVLDGTACAFADASGGRHARTQASKTCCVA